jgi:dihydropteroate synthase
MTRPKVMGIVNATPDSFSDGGRFLDPAAALAHARRMIEEGADILDLGAESSRPGAEPVSAQLEIDRLIPLIEALGGEVPISVDTMKPEVARAAMATGATCWNDVTALRNTPGSLATAAELGCDVILMHMQGEPGPCRTSRGTTTWSPRSPTSWSGGPRRPWPRA